ncbi:MAG TPA: prolipoprotein diacylglyceryl transferase family protein [Candidatus Acidoferrales bacterium]|jgi:phosphatidylglycerol:prolipoprotein diacylglycerol transferase|nr:prolipoprotein diacylglyceryl transferase family protein [Candidatus Acidoferrales bacterium]
MIPYLHLGPLTIPTFGLMVALALIGAAYILQADFDRRGMKADAFFMITVAGLTGILGAKLYHLLEEPGVFFADPWGLLFSRYGFAWFGGFLGGFGALLCLGCRSKMPLLQFLDACSPAAAFGYGIGRIGCFLSGDGDYGKPTNLPWGMSFPNGVVPTTDSCVQWGWPANCRVHPAPLYELAIWCAIGAFLWHLGTRALKSSNTKTTAGTIFCSYLILTGIGRFLVEIIRINPRSFLGMTNAQVASVASVIAGLLLIWWIKSRIQRPTRAHK